MPAPGPPSSSMLASCAERVEAPPTVRCRQLSEQNQVLAAGRRILGPHIPAFGNDAIAASAKVSCLTMPHVGGAANFGD